MNEDQFDRTARTWLEDGPTRMSDRAVQAALDEVHVTRQRRLWWPARRFLAMNTPMRLAGTTAAVALVAALGVALVIRPGGGPGSKPSPTPAATPTSTPSPSLLTETGVWTLEPGTYVSGDPFSVRVTFTVPAGWEASIGGPYLLDLGRVGVAGVGLGFSIFENVSVDPCHSDQGFQDLPSAPTVDSLATALTNVRGLDATTPLDVTLGGQRGKQLTLTAPATFDGCTLSPDGYTVWELPLGATYVMVSGERNTVRILDVGGKTLVIDSPERPGSTAEQRAAIQEILNSVRLEPIN